MSVATIDDLHHRLQRARVRRFVGRMAEQELFATRLRAAEPGSFSVLWVHGPGGIGKSSLLRAYADQARAAGCRVTELDGGRMGPTAGAVRSAIAGPQGRVGEPGGGDRRVIIIDAAEQLTSAEDWLREEFLPTLPASTLVVIAGRRPPGERWRSDPGWRELLQVVGLRNLCGESVRLLLDIEGLSGRLLNRVMDLTHGHPLAVSLLIDALLRGGPAGVPETLRELPDVVATLLQRIVDEAPSGRHREALQVCAHAPVTTEPVLRAGLRDVDDDLVSELWEWLGELTFVEQDPTGLRPHEVARDIVDADLRRRDPEAYSAVHRRLRAYAVDQLRRAAGNLEAVQHAVGDLLFLVRDHPAGGVGWDWDAFGQPPGECVGSDEVGMIIALTRQAQGEEQAELAAHWLRRQPDAFRLFRDSDGEIAGYVARLALHLASAEDIAADPGTAAVWAYTEEHVPARPGEQLVVWRFLVDRDADERHARLTGTLFGAWHISDILLRSPTAWDVIACYADLDHWLPFFRHWDFVHTPEADYQIGDRRYATFAHDWRRVGVADWLELTTARELGEQVPSDPIVPAASLSRDEFAASVKQALRVLHQPAALLRNPLVASGMVQHRLRDHPDARPDRVLHTLIIEAARVLRADPRADAQYRVLDRTYLRPAPSQEKAAELLGLPFTTYRRYRDRGIEAISTWLWDRDLDSR